jgi:hypothetical protein
MQLKYKADTVIRAIQQKIQNLKEKRKEEIEKIIRQIRRYFENMKPVWYEGITSYFYPKKIDLSWLNNLKNSLENENKFIDNDLICLGGGYHWGSPTCVFHINREQYITDLKRFIIINENITDWQERYEIVQRVDFNEIILTDDEARRLNL